MDQFEEELFRPAAIENYLKCEEGGGLLRVSPPWAWAIFWTMGAIVLAAVIASLTCSIEITSRGRGVLRPSEGVRILNAQVAGTVAQVLVHSGDRVQFGQPILRLDSASVKAQLLEADRQLELLRSEFKVYSEHLDLLYIQQEATLKARLTMLEDQIRSQEQSVGLYKRKVNAKADLAKAGLESEMNVDDAREAMAQAERQLSSNQQALASARQELTSLSARRQEELWKRQQELRQAENRRDALRFSQDQTEVKAPVEGVLEAVLAKPGDLLQAGQVLGKIVPQATSFRVICFVQEKDRAFLRPGDISKLEFDQYPYSEFGTLQARILRISDDIATTVEFLEAFGDGTKPEGATYRMELELLQANGSHKKIFRLSSGMLMQVRFTLRRQRPITLLLDPLNRWLN